MSKRDQGIVKPDFSRSNERKLDMSDMFADSVATDFDVQTARKIALDDLLDNPYQPRFHIREEPLDELAQVIMSQGFQGVLVARPHPAEAGRYQLTAGHRRRDAARRAGLDTLPVVVRDLSDEEMVALTITENIQREDLTPFEEGKLYLLMTEEMDYTHEQLAREIGKKRGYVENRIRVARAPEDVQEMVRARPDTLVAAYYLGRMEDEGERSEIIKQVLAGTLATTDIPHYIKAQINAARASKSANGPSIQSAAEGASPQVAPQIGSQTAPAKSWERPKPGEPAETTSGDRAETAPAPRIVEPGKTLSTQGAATAAPTAPTGEAEQNDLAAVKVRMAKLATALSALRTYAAQTFTLADISDGERAGLAQAYSLAGELCERFGIEKVGD
jgi:ParB family chromosome partitioning protein